MIKTPRAGASPAAIVSARVLPQGDGRIFTGAEPRDDAPMTTYRRGEVFTVDAQIALELERRGLVEIQS